MQSLVVIVISLMVCTCVTSHSHVGAQTLGEGWPRNMLGSRSSRSFSRSMTEDPSNMLWSSLSRSSSMNGGFPRGGSAFRSVSNRIYPRGGSRFVQKRRMNQMLPWMMAADMDAAEDMMPFMMMNSLGYSQSPQFVRKKKSKEKEGSTASYCQTTSCTKQSGKRDAAVDAVIAPSNDDGGW